MSSVVKRRPAAPSVDLRYLSAVSKCHHEECSMYFHCSFQGKDIKDAKCKPEAEALRGVHEALMSSIPQRQRTSEVMNDVGFKLLPLFQILIKLYIQHDSHVAMFEDRKGDLKINPVLREIRSTIRDIDAVQKSMGMGDSYLKAAGLVAVPGYGETSAADFVNGDGSYYERMSGAKKG